MIMKWKVIKVLITSITRMITQRRLIRRQREKRTKLLFQALNNRKNQPRKRRSIRVP